MGFEGFLGNNSIKDRLSGAMRESKLSHSFLICGPEGSGKHTLANLLAAAMECTCPGAKPCLSCVQCRKVMDHTHPDVIFVDDPEKKTVQVGLARWAKTDLYIRPNEGKKKIYIFPRAQDMRTEAQNALLKVMEEPPEYGAFLLLSQQPEQLLPTVRSRCVELQLSPVPWEEAEPWLKQRHPGEDSGKMRSAWEQSGGFLGQTMSLLKKGETTDPRALGLIRAFSAGDIMALTEILCKMEKMKREQLIPILRQMQALVAQALSAKAGRDAPETAKELANRKTAARLLEVYRDLGDALKSADANVGVGHICGYLAVRLR